MQLARLLRMLQREQPQHAARRTAICKEHLSLNPGRIKPNQAGETPTRPGGVRRTIRVDLENPTESNQRRAVGISGETN